MARENRQHDFEKALARTLRADSATISGTPCADAETLAAYHERQLPADEMTSWKQHISGCTRCQEILAGLEETEVIPLLPVKETAAATVAPSTAAGKRVLGIPITPPRRSWRWLAPAGAIAAGLLVWVSVRSLKSPGALELDSRSIEVAQNRQPKAPLPQAPPPVITKQNGSRPGAAATSNNRLPLSESATRQTDKALGQGALGGKTSALDQNAVGGGIPSQPANKVQSVPLAPPRKPASTAAPPATGKHVPTDELKATDSELSAKLDNQMTNLPVERRDSTSLSAVTPGAPVPPPPPAAAPTPEPPVHSVTQTVEVTSGASAVAESKAESARAANKKEKTQQRQQMQGMSRFKDIPIPSAGVANGPVTVPSPKGKVLWRASTAGKIERSTDAGATWALQTSGVTTDLLAGSASSDKVCWLAGRLGILLRTTDGGAHWTKLSFPVQDDLIAVSAVSAKRAVLFTQNGSYQTSDGGRTWAKLDIR